MRNSVEEEEEEGKSRQLGTARRSNRCNSSSLQPSNCHMPNVIQYTIDCTSSNGNLQISKTEENKRFCNSSMFRWSKQLKCFLNISNLLSNLYMLFYNVDDLIIRTM